ncbi:hypothetical protein DQ04_00121230 [Trypanosoma grayi]|uniref:hypothetical protein n=1 Tax=Trypanosoma grayi TaxID=71804 RepID=UPI0004F490F3|nr:hypothetical protein DQ04_00121230 [Trypanosoma grayi]KEG15291.1 hypothetical protein DQ04_00121230 [Trypanosoma grayi]
MNAEDALHPWSVSRVFRSLESRRENRADLLTVASSIPDVASRTMLSPLFSHRSIHQFGHSPAFGTISSMCNHALTQQRRYEEEIRSDACVNGQGSSGGADHEVTFAATITSSWLEKTTVSLGAALLPLIGKSQEHLLTALKKRLCDIVQCSSSTSISDKNSPYTSIRKTTTILNRKRAAERVEKGMTLPQRYVLPVGMTSPTNVARNVSANECRELLSQLKNTPVPFQVRSRDEVKLQQSKQKALEASMTVVLPEHVVPLPPWKRRKTDLEDTAEAENLADPPVPLLSAEPVCPQETLQDATWVKEGELVLVNGRLVYREGKKPREGPPKKDKTATPKLDDALNRTTTSKTSAVSKKRKASVDSPRKRKYTKQQSSVYASPSKFNVVSTQNVPLKTREELLTLVNALQISDVLRGAFLIGLNDDASVLTDKSP